MNNFLSIYKSLAEKENIQVDIYVKTAENIAMRDIDLAAVLVNTSDLKQKDGVLKPETDSRAGVSGVMRAVLFYHGEAYFSVENGIFMARIFLRLLDNL